ncbi:MAG: hypothetical protein ACE5JS_09080 [Nitrospinota bacterium]
MDRNSGKAGLQVVRGDITEVEADALVNAPAFAAFDAVLKGPGG